MFSSRRELQERPPYYRWPPSTRLSVGHSWMLGSLLETKGTTLLLMGLSLALVCGCSSLSLSNFLSHVESASISNVLWRFKKWIKKSLSKWILLIQIMCYLFSMQKSTPLNLPCKKSTLHFLYFQMPGNLCRCFHDLVAEINAKGQEVGWVREEDLERQESCVNYTKSIDFHQIIHQVSNISFGRILPCLNVCIINFIIKGYSFSCHMMGNEDIEGKWMERSHFFI